MKNVNDIARSLYDGSWSSEDLKDIMEEYDYSFEEDRNICQELELLERRIITIKANYHYKESNVSTKHFEVKAQY